jgi:hypothetical protein
MRTVVKGAILRSFHQWQEPMIASQATGERISPIVEFPLKALCGS